MFLSKKEYLPIYLSILEAMKPHILGEFGTIVVVGATRILLARKKRDCLLGLNGKVVG